MTNRKLFRSYIGAQSSRVNFSDVPINPSVTFDFILAFAVDVERQNVQRTTNGVLSPFWDTVNLSSTAVREIKSAHPNVRVMLGIGGDSVQGDSNLVFFTPTPAGADSWVDNAFASLRDIIDEYGLDGVDVDYEHFAAGTEVHTFSSCIGRLFARLKTHYPPNKMFTSIAPYCESPVQANYQQLWADHHRVIDYVNFQFYGCGPIPDVGTYVNKYNEQIANYPGAAVLASFLTGTGPMRVTPAVALQTATQLRNENRLLGLFIWSADNSFRDHANGFGTVIQAQEILSGN